MSQKPSVGRIVMVEFRNNEAKPAIITRVWGDLIESLDLSMFTGDHGQPVRVMKDVPHSTFRSARCEVSWSWPERV